MIDTELFKHRAICGLRRSYLESQKILSDINLTTEELPLHQELTDFMEEAAHVVEGFAIEQGVRK